MLRILLGLFLIAHGLIHASYSAPRPPEGPVRWPFELGQSWVLSPLGISTTLARPLGTLLWIAATLLTVAAGLGVFGVPVLHESWRGLAVAGAVASLLLLAIYFDPMLIVGLVIDVALI